MVGRPPTLGSMMQTEASKYVFSSIFAAAVVLSSFALTEWMLFVGDSESRLFIFSAAVFFCTWQGRRWCGLFATLLSILMTAHYLDVGWLTLSIFAIQAFAIVWITNSLIAAKEELQLLYRNQKTQNGQLNLSLSQIRLLNERLHLAMRETHHRVKNSLKRVSKSNCTVSLPALSSPC